MVYTLDVCNPTYQNALTRDRKHTPSADGVTFNVYEEPQITGPDHLYEELPTSAENKRGQTKIYDNLQLNDRNI